MAKKHPDALLVLVPHPDDESYGLGGTLLRLKDRFRLHLLCLTKGERGLSKDHAIAEPETARIREQEERNACALLGAEATFLGRIDGELYADLEICRKVAGFLTNERPAAFFSLWPIDSHPDHAATSEIARKAIRIAGYKGEFYMAEESLSHQTSQFEPDIFVDITEVMEQKCELLRCHACQNRDDALVAAAERQSAFRGSQAGCKYAEGFKTILPLKSSDRSILLSL
ncbi:MAG: PIG-L family deacetylase [Planctomycetes bacterium]|nr:PIG-L family deacetylase [Planctomycetota bacterium]